MKKLFAAAICIAAFIASATAQSAKYAGAMKKTLTDLDSAQTAEQLQNASNGFERIATAEKDQWLPYYYAAYSLVMKGYSEKNPSNIDPTIDKVDMLLSNAEALSANNSEITTLKAMASQLRMMVDPQSRYATFGAKSSQFIKTAEKQNPTNPRVYMFEAQTAYNTPAAFGGSKEKGIELLKKAISLFEAEKPASDIDPSWGKAYAQNILAQWTKG